MCGLVVRCGRRRSTTTPQDLEDTGYEAKNGRRAVSSDLSDLNTSGGIRAHEPKAVLILIRIQQTRDHLFRGCGVPIGYEDTSTSWDDARWVLLSRRARRSGE